MRVSVRDVVFFILVATLIVSLIVKAGTIALIAGIGIAVIFVWAAVQSAMVVNRRRKKMKAPQDRSPYVD